MTTISKKSKLVLKVLAITSMTIFLSNVSFAGENDFCGKGYVLRLKDNNAYCLSEGYH